MLVASSAIQERWRMRKERRRNILNYESRADARTETLALLIDAIDGFDLDIEQEERLVLVLGAAARRVLLVGLDHADNGAHVARYARVHQVCASKSVEMNTKKQNAAKTHPR